MIILFTYELDVICFSSTVYLVDCHCPDSANVKLKVMTLLPVNVSTSLNIRDLYIFALPKCVGADEHIQEYFNFCVMNVQDVL